MDIRLDGDDHLIALVRGDATNLNQGPTDRGGIERAAGILGGLLESLHNIAFGGVSGELLN